MDTTKTGISPFFQVPASSHAYLAQVRDDNAFWNHAADEFSDNWVSVKAPASATAVISKPAAGTAVLSNVAVFAKPEPTDIDSLDFWVMAFYEFSDQAEVSCHADMDAFLLAA